MLLSKLPYRLIVSVNSEVYPTHCECVVFTYRANVWEEAAMLVE